MNNETPQKWEPGNWELATEQLATIKAVLKARFGQEVYEEAEYLRVKEVKHA